VNSKIRFLKYPIILAGVFFIASMLFSSKGYCSLVGIEIEIQEITEEVKELVFSPAIIKIVLMIGGGAGIFQSFLAGSIRPLLIWGGLGLAVFYFPKLFQWIGSV